jgi:hypothetical protein
MFPLIVDYIDIKSIYKATNIINNIAMGFLEGKLKYDEKMEGGSLIPLF